jgi:hypothetical protein
MMHQRHFRGLAAAGMLTGALAVAGCGTAVAGAGSGLADSGASGTAGATGSTAAGSTGSTATGCASVGQATKVTVIRAMHLIEPTRVGSLERTQTNAADVRALFQDFCNVVTHPDRSTAPISCPDEIGLAYGGTFYDASRVLASYTYKASGCQVVTVTADGKSQTAVVFGTAAQAAPNLETDLAKVLGLPKSAVFQPYGGGGQGGTGQGGAGGAVS